MDKQRHKLYMAQILSLIFKDKDLCNVIGFKGGTALMFFHNLPRFSTDLDFNLLDVSKQDVVYNKVRQILLRFGTIDDEAKKLYGPILVLNYGKGENWQEQIFVSSPYQICLPINYVLWVKDSHLAMFLTSGFSCSRCMPVLMRTSSRNGRARQSLNMQRGAHKGYVKPVRNY